MSADSASVFVKPAAFEARMALLFSAQFAPNAIAVAYFPLWLKDLGFTPEQIAMVLAAPLVLRVPASALISAMADRAADRVPVLVAVALATSVLSAGFFLWTGYAAVLAIALAMAVFWGPQTPLVDSLALSGVRRFGSNYNLMRGVGSVAFLSANVAGGYIVAAAGPQIVPTLLTGGFAVLVVVALVAPRLGRPRRQAPLPGEALGQASLLKDRAFVLFVVAGAVIMSSHAHFYTFGSIYWRSLGIGEDVIGWLWAVSVLSEVALFMAPRRVFAHWRPTTMLMLGGAFAIARWIAMPAIGAAGLGAPGFFALAVTHAFTFSASFSATQRLMAERVEEAQMGSAQALMTFCNGLFLALFTLAGGPLYRLFGPESFAAMSLAGAAGIAIAWAAARQPQSAGTGGRTSEPE